MSIENNDSFVQVTVKELSKDDCDYDIINKLADHLNVTIKNDGSNGAISICREGFTDTFTGSYCIRENGDGTTVGLFKLVNNKYEQVKFALPGELALAKGSGIGPIEVPSGWRLVQDESLQRKYNIGAAPNWEVAVIEYIGI